MWKAVSIDEKQFFIQCKFQNNNSECIVFDMDETWKAEETLTVVHERLKSLNKRIRLDEDTISLVFREGQPEQATWTVYNETMHEKTLRIKYRVKSGFFNFEWCLRKQNEHEVKQLLLIPFVYCFTGLSQQISELREIVKKKDAEVFHYKTEFGALKIKTAATKPFNGTDFDRKYADINNESGNLQQIAQHLQSHIKSGSQLNEVNIKTASPSTSKLEEIANHTWESSVANEKKTESPRNKKRKIREAQIQLKINARKKKLEYESSQSLSPEIKVENENDGEALNDTKRMINESKNNDLNGVSLASTSAASKNRCNKTKKAFSNTKIKTKDEHDDASLIDAIKEEQNYDMVNQHINESKNNDLNGLNLASTSAATKNRCNKTKKAFSNTDRLLLTLAALDKERLANS